MVSIINSLHNSQELIRDQLGRNSLLATYLYWVFRLPDPPRDMQNPGASSFKRMHFFCFVVPVNIFALSVSSIKNFLCFFFPFVSMNMWSGTGGAVPSAESRYSTMGRATAATVGSMLLQSRIRSSSNPDIPGPHNSAEDDEVKNILSAKVLTSFISWDFSCLNLDLVQNTEKLV